MSGRFSIDLVAHFCGILLCGKNKSQLKATVLFFCE